ncbi:conserved Plasmodium protein, unknown function [Plasmodium ovale]|uniref:Uncharacterized protein n=1 Tax=Plasmodium ovale TaxID=36330 RepID=A0A1D3KYR4_PLAOA|nr:conserved Plasmodium protein, unknown function [Plasmodium ovale]
MNHFHVLPLLASILLTVYTFAIRICKRYPIRSYIAIYSKKSSPNFVKNNFQKNHFFMSIKKTTKWKRSICIKSKDEEDITYEDIEEYLEKNKINDYEEDEGKKEIRILLNYLPTLKNDQQFFSKFGYVSKEKKSMEYYFNEMKKLKENKQKKNYNILNFLLSYFLKNSSVNILSQKKNYKNLQSYYDYINNIINSRDSFPIGTNGNLSRNENIFSKKSLCKFLSFYLRNVDMIKYISFFCVSGFLTFMLRIMLRNIKLEKIFLLRNYFNFIYAFKNVHVYKIGIFSLLLNLLFAHKYNQYFSITENIYATLFSNYFSYHGIDNIKKLDLEEFMKKFNYTIDDVLNSLNDIFSQYMNRQIYGDEKIDETVLSHVNGFTTLYQKLFSNNRENVINIISLILNTYHTYCTNRENKNKDVLSKIFFLFYIISLKFKYGIADVHRLNLHLENVYKVPFFSRNTPIAVFPLLTHLAQQLSVSTKRRDHGSALVAVLISQVEEKVISEYILERMKKDYEEYVCSLLQNKLFSNNILEDVKNMNFVTLDTRIIGEINTSIFVRMVNNILEKEKYEIVYAGIYKCSSGGSENERGDMTEGDSEHVEFIHEDITYGDGSIKSEKIDNDFDNSKCEGNNDSVMEQGENITWEEGHMNNDITPEEEDIDVNDTTVAGDNDIDIDIDEVGDDLQMYSDDSVDYSISDDTLSIHLGKDKENGNFTEKEKKELAEKEEMLKKIKDIHFLRKYLNIDRQYMDKFLEKYISKFMYKEYKIFIHNIIFKKLKEKNNNLFFLKKGISISRNSAINVIKDIITNFVIKTKENINIFSKLGNTDKCLKLILNLLTVYKKIKKKQKFLKIGNESLPMDNLFSYNLYSQCGRSEAGMGKRSTDGNFGEEDVERISKDDDHFGEEDMGRISQDDDHFGEEDMGRISKDDDHFGEEDMGGISKDDDHFGEEDMGRPRTNQEPTEEGDQEILSLEERKRLYEEFVLKYMKNKSERNILKVIFNLDFHNIDEEIENNIINRFLENVVTKNIQKLKEANTILHIIGNDNLYDYKNVPSMESKGIVKEKRNHTNEKKIYVNDYIITKDKIFEQIDNESFENMCRKMYINKLLQLKENIYQNRKDIYFYQIVLNIKNVEKLHDIYIIDQYEKMIHDIIKTNMLNKNYGNIKNIYLKKIINFLNISDEKANDVELRCIYQQTYSVYKKIKENFYIYKCDNDFVNNINELLIIYNNFNLIKKNGDTYYVKFALIDPNYNLVHRVIERYVLHVIDIINSENREILKENVFKLTRVLNVSDNVVDIISAKIYKKYVENQDLPAINNMDSFFNFLFNMEREKQSEIVLEHLKKKSDGYLTSSESLQEKLQKLHDLLLFINNNLQLKKNIFDLSSATYEEVYEFLTACIDDYLHRKKTDSFLSAQSDYLMHLKNFLSKLKILIRGQEENSHFTRVLNMLKNDIIERALGFLDKFKYDMCVQEIYNLIKLQMIDGNMKFSDIDIEKRRKLVNIFSYQNISEEKKFLYLGILNKALL